MMDPTQVRDGDNVKIRSEGPAWHCQSCAIVELVLCERETRQGSGAQLTADIRDGRETGECIRHNRPLLICLF